ncbi:MAG: hypothetical protein BGO54_07055 [Sphingobacteriales bacterium 46-32]|nr:MAG: hypothetical protein BGO54_07055 [Sphingobacteriales bacterium 46-32]
MKLNRNYITPFISLVFLVVGLSGLLMLFHLFDGYTEVVHEILGVFFIICAIFHIILNWKALRIHFKKGVFIPALLGVLVLSVILIISERMSPPVDLIIFNKMVKAPINDAFRALDINYEKASEKLKENGLSIEEATTIEDIWINNDSNPEKVIDLIME